MRNLVLVGLMLLSFNQVLAQATLRIMYYNLLNFPSVSPERIIYLRQILAYVQPDVLVVNELLTGDGSDMI